MEEGIQWYPLPEVKSPEDNWDHISSTASKPQHTHTQKYTSEWKHSPTTTQRDHSSRPFPTTCTPSEVRPGDLSISTLFTVSPNTTGNTSTNIHTLKNTSNISHHTLQCKPVPSHSQGVQSLSQQRRDGIQSGPSPLSHSLKSSHQTIATPRLTLTELDDLWKKFLASSLASTQLRDENSQPTCTCGTVGENQTRDEHLTTSDSSHHATKISERPGKHGDSRKVKRDYLSRRKHRSTHRKESLLKECAVQTSPQPPEDHSPAPPVTFSLPPDGKGGVQISHLTLSEALAVQYPEFIERSLQRQRKLRECQRDGYHRSLGQYTSQDKPTAVWRTAPPTSHQSIASGHHPKVSMKEMYRASKKAWDQLPEVRAKVNEDKRKSQAATNRLKVKLYQQEVLSRLRRKKNM